MAANRMSHLEVLIGTWNTTGEVLKTATAPASKLIATDTYRWLPGKQFIVHDADARFGNIAARSMEVIGYDRAKKRYFARSFDDQGVTELFGVALTANSWTIVGKSVRFHGTLNARNTKLTGLWELKDESAGWKPWIRLRLDRV